MPENSPPAMSLFMVDFMPCRRESALLRSRPISGNRLEPAQHGSSFCRGGDDKRERHDGGVSGINYCGALQTSDGRGSGFGRDGRDAISYGNRREYERQKNTGNPVPKSQVRDSYKTTYNRPSCKFGPCRKQTRRRKNKLTLPTALPGSRKPPSASPAAPRPALSPPPRPQVLASSRTVPPCHQRS